MFEIKKNVPLPARTGGFTSRPSKYPFAQMTAGDYIEVPVPEGRDAKKFEATVRSSTSAFAAKNPVSFSLRTHTNADGKLVVGVWMVGKRTKKPSI